jgi:two-component system KDP operon response regulator KdpE
VTRVLLVEDDPGLARALAITLRARAYEVSLAGTGRAALDLAASHPPDLVILDLGLPDLDGVEVVQALRGWTSVPIVVLSARHDSHEKVHALDAGADDYVTKPFGMDELLARLRAATRRASVGGDEPVIPTAAFSVDLARRRVVLPSGADVRLTPTEWRILEVLARNAGRIVGHRELLRAVRGPNLDTDAHYLRVYLAQLRAKLEPDPARPQHLVTEPGVGYRLMP